MEALDDTVRAGKARYLGASTMYAWQFAKMNHVAAMNGWTPFVNMKCQYNVLYREEEREMLPYCRDQGIAVTTFSPLARGTPWTSVARLIASAGRLGIATARTRALHSKSCPDAQPACTASRRKCPSRHQPTTAAA